MTLEPNVKKVILSKTKRAIDDLEKSKFDGMKKLFSIMISLTELVTDEVWEKEIKLSALVISGVGSTTEGQFEEMDKKKQEDIVETYTEMLNSFYRAVEKEDVTETDYALKNLVNVFIDELLL